MFSVDVECVGSDCPKGRKAAKKRKHEETKALEVQKELINIWI
jgi:hypothetical protein